MKSEALDRVIEALEDLKTELKRFKYPQRRDDILLELFKRCKRQIRKECPYWANKLHLECMHILHERGIDDYKQVLGR